MLPHSHDVLAVAFRPDGKQLACATLDGQLHLWDPLEGELQVLLSVLTLPVQPLLCVHVAGWTLCAGFDGVPRRRLGTKSQFMNTVAYSQMQYSTASCSDTLTWQGF